LLAVLEKTFLKHNGDDAIVSSPIFLKVFCMLAYQPAGYRLKSNTSDNTAYPEKVFTKTFSQIADFVFFCYTTNMTVETIKKQIVPILKRQGVIKAAVFGSAARGEMTKKSDVDILIKYGSKKSLFDLIRLEFDLGKKLGRKVDLLTYKSIHHLLRDIILKEQKVIYESKKRS
jgi:predicted nucleotidyltransferase